VFHKDNYAGINNRIIFQKIMTPASDFPQTADNIYYLLHYTEMKKPE